MIATLDLTGEVRQMKPADKLSTTTHRTPPHPALAFRVGVVGHRPNRLDKANIEQLAASVRTILSTVKDETLAVERESTGLYDSADPVLKAVSPLAEGTDRIFAEQALHLGFALCCVMPFPQAEFERDFASGAALEDDSLPRFRRLLARATTRFELDGTRAEEAEAYGAGGRVVLNQSDLLVVVWDGERLGKRGGTEETFDDARSRGLPVAWIDAHAPHEWQLLDAATSLPRVPDGQRVTPDGSGSAAALRKQVREALELPKPLAEAASKAHAGSHNRAEDPRPALELFYAEQRPRWSLAVFWKAFLQVVADANWPKVRIKLEDLEVAIKPDWPEDQSTPVARMVDYLRPFYAWPDKLAVLYADRYRNAFLLAFLLAAAAVGLALLPVALGLLPHHGAEIACIALEFVAILTILALVFQGRRRRWHERWIDYRLTAELVRHLRLVAPLGGGRPLPQIPAQWATYGQPGASWMAWYVRAVERALGLPCAVVDKAYLDGYLAQLAHLLSGQINFHETNARRCHNMERRLHRCGIALLALTLLACGLHLALSVWHAARRPTWLPPQVLTFVCGFFPALGAALAGIINQGEFRSLTNRSEAMREQLDLLLNETTSLRQRIASMPDSAMRQSSVQAVALARATAGLLVNEVLDWRVVLLDQPLRPPA
jgi:hypothetical protein